MIEKLVLKKKLRKQIAKFVFNFCQRSDVILINYNILKWDNHLYGYILLRILTKDNIIWLYAKKQKYITWMILELGEKNGKYEAKYRSQMRIKKLNKINES